MINAQRIAHTHTEHTLEVDIIVSVVVAFRQLRIDWKTPFACHHTPFAVVGIVAVSAAPARWQHTLTTHNVPKDGGYKVKVFTILFFPKSYVFELFPEGILVESRCMLVP